MTSEIVPWTVLLLIAAVVGVFARRLHVPYSIGLVVAGIGLAFVPWHPGLTLTRDIVYTGLLPPLIFEAAFELRWAPLKSKLPLVATLATVGVVLSALATGAFMVAVTGWPVSAALVFGIVIAATDPVAVVATVKEVGARGSLALVIEAESLFNDGTAAVLFAIAIGFGAGVPLTFQAAALTLLATVVVGVVAGAASSRRSCS